ncbi:MAG TPA: ABC transporter ATP-binding protein [Thermoanaerobaculia bacterium]|nr:ABC transporter ATP-binding protein [Thermoanaerobaculia bacterium]
MAAVLEARSLTKRLGGREVVSAVSFAVEPGEIFGFLGPNGAGKTTTVRMLTGLVRPDAGTAVIAGFDVRREFESAMRHVGAIVESPDLYGELTGRENLELFARMIGRDAARRIPDLGALVSLAARLDDRVSTYSLGMRQRLGLAQALLGDPRVLILDEPANGLDPAGIREVRELLRALARERGISVFLSSHLLAEVEQTCDRVAILHRGKVLALDTVESLLATRSRVRFRTPIPKGARAALRRHAASEPEIEGDDFVVAELAEDEVPRALTTLSAEGVPVFEVTRERPALEDLFLELTHGETV